MSAAVEAFTTELMQFRNKKPHQRKSPSIHSSMTKEVYDTSPKTNVEPENGPLEKEIPFGNHPFQIPCWFWRVYLINIPLPSQPTLEQNIFQHHI